MNVWKILTIIFVTLLDLSKLHEKEFLELLEEINNQSQTKTRDIDSVIGAGEVFVEQQSGSKSRPNSPPSINRFENNRSKTDSKCQVEASVLKQDIFSLIGNVLQTTFPNLVGDNSKDELARFTSNKRHQKNVITAEMSTKNLVSAGKDLKLFLGQDFFKEMIIVNRIKNLHNLWFLSDLNFDQIITYMKLIISILKNKGMFINSESIKVTFSLYPYSCVLTKQTFSFIHF